MPVMNGVRKVRARLKAIEEIPDWAKCCEEHVHAFEAVKDQVLTMLVGSEFVGKSECVHCGRITENLVFAYVEESSPEFKKLAIALCSYDIDEGLAVTA
jgi:hypothetical protein